MTGAHSAWGQAKSSSDGRVVVSGHVSRDMVRVDSELRFWITVENRSPAPLANVHLDRLEIAGFQKSRWCWGPNIEREACGIATRPGPPCLAPSVSAAASSDEFALCAYLRPREVLTVWGDLKANADLPPHELIALLSWQELPEPVAPCKFQDKSKCPPAPAKPAEAANASPIVTLGKAEPVAGWRYLFRRYTPRAEISIPGALTLLGLFFTWWSGRREQKNQIFTTMLGQVHEFTMHYYMPMTSMLSTAAKKIDEFRLAARALALAGTPIPPDPLSAGRRGFYYLTMFHWWKKEIFQKVGAYHLKTRVGESLLYTLSSEHAATFVGNSEAAWRRLDRVKALVTQETSLDEFLEILDLSLDPDLTQLWLDYVAWAGRPDCETYVAVLESFVAVMIYEVNNVSADWYSQSEKIELSPRAQTHVRAKADTSKDIARYLRVAKRGWRIPLYDRFV